MIRILHTADIHLDSPLRSAALRNPELQRILQAATRRAFARLVDHCLDKRVSALLISGDLYDGKARSAQTAAFLVAQMDRLRAENIQVFIIRGNHDAENPLTGEVAFPDNVHVFTARGGKVQLAEQPVWIHGVSFGEKHVPDSLLPRFQTPVPDAINIAMLHTSLAGASGHDVYAPCSVAQLQSMGFDYWALGHVHGRMVHSTAPWVVMPGMPQGRDIGEAGPKSASLLTLEDGRVTAVDEVPTSAVMFQQIHMDLTGQDSESDLRDRLRAQLRQLAEAAMGEGTILRLVLTGETSLRWRMLRDAALWRETVQAMAEETGRLWIDKLVFDLQDPAQDAPGALAELGALMQTIGQEPGLLAEARAEIDTMLQLLPADRRAALMPDEAALETLARSLLDAGGAELLARMRGAGD